MKLVNKKIKKKINKTINPFEKKNTIKNIKKVLCNIKLNQNFKKL